MNTGYGVGIAGLAVCIAIAVIPMLRILLAHRPRPEGEADGGSSDDGGGGLRRPRGPWPEGEGGPEAPAWWPEFEHDFALHVAFREATRRTRDPAVG